jgi:hypothetical protein
VHGFWLMCVKTGLKTDLSILLELTFGLMDRSYMVALKGHALSKRTGSLAALAQPFGLTFDLRPLRFRRTLQRPIYHLLPLFSVLCESAGLYKCDCDITSLAVLQQMQPLLSRSASWPILP